MDFQRANAVCLTTCVLTFIASVGFGQSREPRTAASENSRATVAALMLTVPDNAGEMRSDRHLNVVVEKDSDEQKPPIRRLPAVHSPLTGVNQPRPIINRIGRVAIVDLVFRSPRFEGLQSANPPEPAPSPDEHSDRRVDFPIHPPLKRLPVDVATRENLDAQPLPVCASELPDDSAGAETLPRLAPPGDIASPPTTPGTAISRGTDLMAPAPIYTDDVPGMPSATYAMSPAHRRSHVPGDSGRGGMDDGHRYSSERPAAEVGASPEVAAFPALESFDGSIGAIPLPVASPMPTAESLQAVTQQAEELIAKGFAMAERGATFSAAKNFRQALLVIARALDAHAGVEEHSAALGRAWRALREAEQFATSGSMRDAELTVASIVVAHRTPVLQQVELAGITPVTAAQRYYSYAQEQLAKACAGVPAGARALYGLGKLEAAAKHDAQLDGHLHLAQAMVFQQAALLVDAGNGLAANELGVMLARVGAWPAARQVLTHGVASNPQPAAWRNLAIVHERLGETQLAQLAHREWQAAQRQTSFPASRPNLDVEWVLPEQMNARPAPIATPAASEDRTARREPAQRSPSTPSHSASGSWWQVWK